MLPGQTFVAKMGMSYEENCCFSCGGGGFPYKTGGGRVFSPKRCTTEAFAVPFSYGIEPKTIRIGDNVLFLGVKKISSHSLKTGSWHLLGVHFKISDEHPSPLYVETPPPPCQWLQYVSASCLCAMPLVCADL